MGKRVFKTSIFGKRMPKNLKLSSFSIKKLKNINKNTLLAGSLVLVLLLVGLWAVLFNKNTNTELAPNEEETVEQIETADPMGAKLSLAEGVVEYRSESGIWEKAPTELALLTGDSLRTIGAASRAIVTLEDGSAVRIDSNTEVNFETLSQSKVVVAQTSGYIYNRVTPSSTRTYIVRTENAQFESTGTAFRTTSSGDEEAVEVFQSTVKETTTNLSAEEGERLIVKSGNNPERNKTKEKLDIEKLKDDEFIKWNREQDLNDPNFKNSLGFLSDFDGPTIDILEPAVGSTITVGASSPSGSVNIKGRTEKGAKLTVQSKSQNGSTVVGIAVSGDGSFETGELIAPIGNSIFEFVATDWRGNKSTLNISYIFIRETSAQTQAINLDFTQSGGKINFSWSLVGMTTPDGVMLVWSKDKKPTLQDKDNIYVETGISKQLNESGYTSGETYYFRVCRYSNTSKTCDVYSNEVKVVIP